MHNKFDLKPLFPKLSNDSSSLVRRIQTKINRGKAGSHICVLSVDVYVDGYSYIFTFPHPTPHPLFYRFLAQDQEEFV